MTIQRATWWLVLSWLVIGVISSLAGFLGLLRPGLSLLLIVPSVLLCGMGWKVIQHWKDASLILKILLVVLGGLWLMHSVGVLMPETGFDAVWYHLPIILRNMEVGSFVYQPALYQSLNPLFSDTLFLLGWGLFLLTRRFL